MHNVYVITTADREDPYYMTYSVEFHQSLHCLLRKNDLQGINCNFI